MTGRTLLLKVIAPEHVAVELDAAMKVRDEIAAELNAQWHRRLWDGNPATEPEAG